MEVKLRCLGNSEKADSFRVLFVTLMAAAVVVEKGEEKKTLSLAFVPSRSARHSGEVQQSRMGKNQGERSFFCTYLEHRPVLEPYQSSCAHSFLIKVILRKSAKPFSISSLKRRRSSL